MWKSVQAMCKVQWLFSLTMCHQNGIFCTLGSLTGCTVFYVHFAMLRFGTTAFPDWIRRLSYSAEVLYQVRNCRYSILIFNECIRFLKCLSFTWSYISFYYFRNGNIFVGHYKMWQSGFPIYSSCLRTIPDWKNS